jgi:hypothetical protein
MTNGARNDKAGDVAPKGGWPVGLWITAVRLCVIVCSTSEKK